MSVGDIFKIGQEAPKSGKYHCIQCTNAGVVNGLILEKDASFLPCDSCREDGRPDRSKVKFKKNIQVTGISNCFSVRARICPPFYRAQVNTG